MVYCCFAVLNPKVCKGGSDNFPTLGAVLCLVTQAWTARRDPVDWLPTGSSACWVLPARSACVRHVRVLCCSVVSLSRVRLFATSWTVAHQAPLSVVLFRQEYWSGFPFPSPGDLPKPEIEPVSRGFFTIESPGKPLSPPYHNLKKIPSNTRHSHSIALLLHLGRARDFQT